MEPSTAGRPGPARRFAGRRPLRFAFFCTVVFGQRQQRGGLLGVLPGAGGRCRRFRLPSALLRRLPRDAERMRAAEELRLFADLWTHAATPPVSVPASLASDSALPAPGRGLIGIGCPSLESDSARWIRTRRFQCLRQAVHSWHLTRLFCLPVFFFGVWHSSCGRASSASGAALWNRRTVPGIRFRAPGTRVGVPSGKVGGVFPCARTQAGPPVGEGLRGGSRSGFFSCANRGSGCFKECFWENQCIMEGSHRLSCGKATMRPTHTNRPTT